MTARLSLSLQQEAALSILRAADMIQQDGALIMKQFDLTPPQFNVLRILRGSPDGLACGQIGERMITRDPDITRLLDRLEARLLLERERSDADRRVVNARISQNGLDLLKRVDPVIHEWHREQFKTLTAKQLKQIVDLMKQLQLTGRLNCQNT